MAAIALSAAVALAYWLTAGPLAGRQSTAPHFVLLADAIWHGRLWIDPLRSAQLVDVTPFGGRVYVAFPPLPALLMLPFVAVAGPDFNDVRFTLALGALNAGLAYLAVRRLSTPGFAGPGISLGRRPAAVVAAFLAVGTVHYYAALMGRVWFTAHVVAVTCLLLYLWECAGRGRPLVAGAALAGALLARPPAIFGAVFWLGLASHRYVAWRGLVVPAALFALAPGVAMALLLALNALRFGNPLDFGYLSMRVSPQLAPDLHRYGQFSLHFLPRNVAAFLLMPPVFGVAQGSLPAWWRAAGGASGLVRLLTVPGFAQPLGFPVRFDPWGTGLWAVSPAFVFCLRRPRAVDRPLFAAAWLAAITTAIPNLLYYNTGWGQYGYRFSLDFTPFLLVLLALGLRRPLGGPGWSVFGLMFAVSAASNWLGARWFLRLPPY